MLRATLRGGLLLLAAGVVLTLLTHRKLALMIVFAGVAVLVYGVISACLQTSTDGKEPPIL